MSTALLLVAHGTPETVEDIPAFLANIRRGRATPPEVVDEVKRRYAAIGGSSPMLRITREQAALLSTRLGIPAFVGMRMWHPYLGDTLRELASGGFQKVVALVMAPHSAQVYGPVLQQEADKLRAEGVTVPAIEVAPNLGEEQGLADTFAAIARDTLGALDPSEVARCVLVPSAHSLPLRVVQAGDPYPQLVEQTAEAAIKSLGGDAIPHMLAYQSQGMTSDAWLGPDLPTVFQRAKNTGARGVVVLPVGFLCDHVETLYDLDIEAVQIAREYGLWFRRAPCPNTHPLLLDTLEVSARRMI